MKQNERENELRFREHEVRLSNQAIVEMAYLTKDLVEATMGHKLSWSEANCYLACFYECRKLLKAVDEEYLKKHDRLREFYKDGKELSNDWDRLAWETGHEDTKESLFFTDADGYISRKKDGEKVKDVTP